MSSLTPITPSLSPKSSEASSQIERFVPFNSASTAEDAPGWHYKQTANESTNASDEYIFPNNNENQYEDSHKRSKDSDVRVGPTCWKCKGSGTIQKRPKLKNKKLKQESTNASIDNGKNTDKDTKEPSSAVCTVCQGNGHVPCKQKEIIHQNEPGVVTKTRTCAAGWKVQKPHPFVISKSIQSSAKKDLQTVSQTQQYIQQIHSGLSQDLALKWDNKVEADNLPSWVPRKGEQLCNLVGSWRILQRVGSHRWTTDDLVTAYVASSLFIHRNSNPDSESKVKFSSLCFTTNQNQNVPSNIQYLDLGCGNASVLQMVLWKLLSHFHIHNDKCETNEKATPMYIRGIEARKEAIQFARRSLSFNVGYNTDENSSKDNNNLMDDKLNIRVIHSDFRTLIEEGTSILNDCESTNKTEREPLKFDLVTGTPPYFQVDFQTANFNHKNSSNSKNNDSKSSIRRTQAAVINQGGMPTSVQSAPARCEFRGGVEAYCEAASMVLKPDTGIFCVCENYLNHDRVLTGASKSGLVVEHVLFIRGKVGKRVPLFGVYVMRKKASLPEEIKNDQSNEGMFESVKQNSYVEEDIAVRDEEGNWTDTYKDLLEFMSIPARS